MGPRGKIASRKAPWRWSGWTLASRAAGGGKARPARVCASVPGTPGRMCVCQAVGPWADFFSLRWGRGEHPPKGRKTSAVSGVCYQKLGVAAVMEASGDGDGERGQQEGCPKQRARREQRPGAMCSGVADTSRGWRERLPPAASELPGARDQAEAANQVGED